MNPRFIGIIVILFLVLPTSELFAETISIRPMSHDGSPTKIYCSMAILDIDEISDANQNFTVNLYARCRWKDPREAHQNSGKVIKDLKEIWHPRLFFLNRQKLFSSAPNVVEISQDGSIVYRNKFWGDFSQPLNLRDFPFDTQELKITIVYSGSEEFGEVIILQDPETQSFIVDEHSVADWEVVSSQVDNESMVLPTGEKAAAFTMTFTAKRISTYYMIKSIAPLLMILALSWVVFWLDPSEGAQLGVAVTTCLTVIAYHLALSSTLPRIPYLTHLDVFVFGATFLVFLAMLEVVITTSLAKNGRVDSALKLDRYSRFVFPGLLALIILYAFFLR